MPKYEDAISEYNLRELRRALDQWNDDALATMLVMDIVQVRLLKRIVSSYTKKEE